MADASTPSFDAADILLCVGRKSYDSGYQSGWQTAGESTSLL